MKFLLDQNASAGAAEILRVHGLDVVHAREVGLARAEDTGILEWCRREERTIVTLDADFHALLALAGASSPSVIRIRIEGLQDEELARLVLRVLQVVEGDLERGVAVTVTPSSIRMRTLPLTVE